MRNLADPPRLPTLASLLLALLACTGSPDPGPALPPLPEARQADAPPAHGEERPQRELTLVLTGDVRGEIEPCGCPTLPFGGFERRQRLLAELPALGPVLSLDAGELLVRGLSTQAPPPGEREARARVVLAASAAVGVRAWVPGPSDLLALPPDELARVQSPPAVSATWRRPNGTALLPAALVVEAEGRRVGVIGLSAAPTGPALAPLVQARDPVEAAREALAELPADLDLVLALGNLADEEVERVAREVPGLALILNTAGRAWQEPRAVAGVPVIEANDRGRYVQVVGLRLGSTPERPVELYPPVATWRRLVQLRAQARQSEAHAPALAGAEAALASDARGRNLAWVETRPLAPDLDGPAPVAALLGEFKTERLAAAARRAAAPPPPSEPGYATAAACTNCHTDNFARWTFTDHSRAWQSLVERQATGNPECLPCHTTGFGEPGGMGEPTVAAVRAFKAVQCEACHGPMRGHPDDPRVKAEPITEARCTGCHDAANSPEFDYASYLPRAACTSR